MVSWICPNLPFRGSMLRNVQCTPCKIRTIICGNVLCESVKLNEPHVRWCDRSAAKAVSFSILWKIKRNILSGFYTDLLVRRVANRLAPFCAFVSFYTDPLVRRVSGCRISQKMVQSFYTDPLVRRVYGNILDQRDVEVSIQTRS